MALILHVDGARWRAQLHTSLAAAPGLVPVVKGNGYGFGNEVLAAQCEQLREDAFEDDDRPSVDLIAVGTYAELPQVLANYHGDVLVLEPFRALLHADTTDLASTRLLHTVTDARELPALAHLVPSARVVLEGLTSMNRFGMPLSELIAARADLVGLRAEGITLHLPLGEGHESEVGRWLSAVPDQQQWFVSHVPPAALSRLQAAHPGMTIRPRVGTALWLGDREAWWFSAQVLDVRACADGDVAGYRGRRLRAGHLLVVSGGTAHGVAMEAPSAVSSMRQRAIAVAEGMLEAAGRVKAPFVVGGKDTWFVEPPHMQVSLIQLPEGAPVPALGDEVSVRMRATTAYPDMVSFC